MTDETGKGRGARGLFVPFLQDAALIERLGKGHRCPSIS
jgi:hypothetical protein